MATSKSSSSTEPEPEAEAEVTTTEVPPVESEVPAPSPTAVDDEGNYVLPPTLQEAGLVGVVGVTAGQYSTPSGSFFAVSPGQAYVMTGDDATALVEQGAAVKLEDMSPG